MELPQSETKEVEITDDYRVERIQNAIMSIQKVIQEGAIEIGKGGWRARPAVNYLLHTNNLLTLAFKSLGNVRDELAKRDRKEDE